MRRDDSERLSVAEVREILDQMSAADWRRAERYAAARAHGLRNVAGEDLLNEACVQLLGGQRRFPRGHAPLVVLRSAMRSEASNARKSGWERRVDDRFIVEPTEEVDDSGEVDSRTLAPGAVAPHTPEEESLAKEQFDAVAKVLEGDVDVELVAMAWADGLRGKEAIEASGLSPKAYDAARNRLIRKLAQFGPPGGAK